MDEETYVEASRILELLRAEINRAGDIIDAHLQEKKSEAER